MGLEGRRGYSAIPLMDQIYLERAKQKKKRGAKTILVYVKRLFGNYDDVMNAQRGR